MRRVFSIGLLLALSSSVSYARATVGIQGSFRAAVKAIHEPLGFLLKGGVGKFVNDAFKDSERIHREIQEREDALKVISPKAFFMERSRDRQKRINELRWKIVEAHAKVQSGKQQSLIAMEAELRELLVEPLTMESETVSMESTMSSAIDPEPCPSDIAGANYMGIVSGILSIPENSQAANVAGAAGHSCEASASFAQSSQDLSSSFESTSKFLLDYWKRNGHCWDKFVGSDGSGDPNRAFLSDPVVFRLLGIPPSSADDQRSALRGRRILDIGCGNGYLARELAQHGSEVTGIERSTPLLTSAIAAASEAPGASGVIFRRDTASRLDSITEGQCDAAVMNYVLQDCEHLQDCLAQLYRVLRNNGMGVVVIPHPCFPSAYKTKGRNGSTLFRWEKPYHQEHRQSVLVEGFQGDPIPVFHRSLQVYIDAFLSAGFELEWLEEPSLSQQQERDLDPTILCSLTTSTPRSVVFCLRKSAPGVKLLPPLAMFVERSSEYEQDLIAHSIRLAAGMQTVFEVPHPCFPAETPYEWLRPYFESETLSKFFRLFRQYGFEVFRMEEILGNSGWLAKFCLRKSGRWRPEVWTVLPHNFDPPAILVSEDGNPLGTLFGRPTVVAEAAILPQFAPFAPSTPGSDRHGSSVPSFSDTQTTRGNETLASQELMASMSELAAGADWARANSEDPWNRGPVP